MSDLGLNYWDSCPECDSLNLKIINRDFSPTEPGGECRIHVECRDCGADWEDWI